MLGEGEKNHRYPQRRREYPNHEKGQGNQALKVRKLEN